MPHRSRARRGLLGPAVLLLAAILLCTGAPAAQAIDAPRGLTVELTNGYRLDGLRWDIAADPSGTATPNILSELTWSSLQAYELGVAVRTRLGGLVLPAAASVGWILAGDNQDSDYAGDDRTLEFSRSNNQAGGWLLDAAASLGHPFICSSGRLELTPLVGLAYHGQFLRMFDGCQTIATDGFTPPLGPFPGLDSSYHAHWLAIRWAAEAALALAPRLWLEAGLAAHAALYWAEADWNLRPDFAHPVSFAHTADGWGVSGTLGLDWRVHPRWSLGLRGEAHFWRAGPGSDITYFAAGGSTRTRLNQVVWTSGAVRLTTALRL